MILIIWGEDCGKLNHWFICTNSVFLSYLSVFLAWESIWYCGSLIQRRETKSRCLTQIRIIIGWEGKEKATSSTRLNLRRGKIKGKKEERIHIFQFKFSGVREIQKERLGKWDKEKIRKGSGQGKYGLGLETSEQKRRQSRETCRERLSDCKVF